MDVLVRLGKSAENWARWDGRLSQVNSMKSGKVGKYLYCREVIVQGSVRWPNGLALDMVLDRYIHENKSQRVLWKSILRLYWVDAKLSTIGSSALDGSEVFLFCKLFTSHTLYTWHANDLTLLRLCRRGSSCSRLALCDIPSALLFSRTSCKANIRHVVVLSPVCKAKITYHTFKDFMRSQIFNSWKEKFWPQLKTTPGTGVSGKAGQFTKQTSSVARMWPPSLDTW